MHQPQGKNHLALPKRDGVHQGGLDFLGHHSVVALDQPDLRRHLDGHHPGQFQVMELFLKPIAQRRHIVGRLRILRQPRFLGLFHQRRQLLGAHLLQLSLASQNVHGQLLEIGQIELVHLIQQGNVLHKLDLMILQHGADLIHIDRSLVVLGAHGGDFIGGLFEEAEKTALLLRIVHIPQLADQVGHHLPDLAQILGAYVL